jgi:hypothetical protein
LENKCLELLNRQGNAEPVLEAELDCTERSAPIELLAKKVLCFTKFKNLLGLRVFEDVAVTFPLNDSRGDLKIFSECWQPW